MKIKSQILVSVCLIAVIVIVAFYPSLNNGFVNWDDDQYVLNNPLVKDLSVDNVLKMFGSPYSFNYHPLTVLTYSLEHSFFQFNPLVYHLTNLILHLFNCMIVFWLIFLISRNIIIALLTSILFGVHPLAVEPVAWVSGRKDVLYAFFYLGALVAYIHYLRSVKKTKYYVLSLFLFILSALSKASAITLTPMIFLMDYIDKRKFDKNAIKDKIPFMVISLAFGIFALISVSGAVRHDTELNFLLKLKVASYGVIFYIWKLLLPVRLSCLYPYPLISKGIVPWIYNFSFAAMIILSVLVCYSLRHTKKLLFGALFFLLSIFVNLQFVPLGAMMTADRYTYIPAIGIYYLVATVFLWLISKTEHYFLKVFLIATFIMMVFSFVRASRERCLAWENGLVLWNDAITKDEKADNPVAYFNRSLAYIEAGRDDLAFPDLKKSLEFYRGRHGLEKTDSTDIYRKYLEPEPDYYRLFNIIGAQFADISQTDEAIILFMRMTRAWPDKPKSYLNLCVTFFKRGKYKDAVRFGEKAVKLDPDAADGHYFLALAYYYDKQIEPARTHFQEAIRLGMKVPQAFLK
jgi:protein O-mannosyl-transferase